MNLFYQLIRSKGKLKIFFKEKNLSCYSCIQLTQHLTASSVWRLHKPLNELFAFFFINTHEMIHPASKQWPSQADGVKSEAAWHENIIKATRWWWKSKSRQTVDGLCRTSSNQAPASACLRKRSPAIKNFVTALSTSLWAFLISFYFYPALIHLYWSSCTGSAHQAASSLHHLSSIYSIRLLLLPERL